MLLKNDGVLPLSLAIHKIAVVGPLAGSLHVLEGNYSGTPSRPQLRWMAFASNSQALRGLFRARHELSA